MRTFLLKIAAVQSPLASKERKPFKSLDLKGGENKDENVFFSVILDWEKRRLLHQLLNRLFKSVYKTQFKKKSKS